jgi:hypothetical protein
MRISYNYVYELNLIMYEKIYNLTFFMLKYIGKNM